MALFSIHFFTHFFSLLHLNLSYMKRIVLLVPVKLAPPQGLDNLGLELVMAPHREKDLSNPHTSCGSMSFAVGSPHSGLEPIGSSTGQHFVDPKHVERMDANPDVEAFLATVLDKVLVAADPRRLESLRGELLQLVRHKMDREGELINTSPLPSQVKDPDLGVRDTTVEPK